MCVGGVFCVCVGGVFCVCVGGVVCVCVLVVCSVCVFCLCVQSEVCVCVCFVCVCSGWVRPSVRPSVDVLAKFLRSWCGHSHVHDRVVKIPMKDKHFMTMW